VTASERGGSRSALSKREGQPAINPVAQTKPVGSSAKTDTASVSTGSGDLKRGVKRALERETSNKPPKPVTVEDAQQPGKGKVKRRIVLTDEEEEEAPRKAKPTSVKTEDSLMDDSNEANKASASSKIKKKAQKPKGPLDSKGRPKRKIQKSRTFKDEKGYIRTEDYSSYESVSEEEETEEHASGSKMQGTGKDEATMDKKPAVASIKGNGGKTGTDGAGQKKIMNFFKKKA